jgi:hypothetical protein
VVFSINKKISVRRLQRGLVEFTFCLQSLLLSIVTEKGIILFLIR